jgi:hypothetical protein
MRDAQKIFSLVIPAKAGIQLLLLARHGRVKRQGFRDVTSGLRSSRDQYSTAMSLNGTRQNWELQTLPSDIHHGAVS